MGLFGPSKEEMTDAVANGIHRAIQITRSSSYHIKQGKKMVNDQYYTIPPEINVELYDPSKPPELVPLRRVKVPGYFIIYEVIYRETQTRYNPFTDVRTSNVINEQTVARYYSYDGYDMDKIHRFIRFAREQGFYPSEKHLEEWALKGSR